MSRIVIRVCVCVFHAARRMIGLVIQTHMYIHTIFVHTYFIQELHSSMYPIHTRTYTYIHTHIHTNLYIQENLFYGRNVSQTFDLKGSLRSRYVQQPSKVCMCVFCVCLCVFVCVCVCVVALGCRS